MGIKPVNYRQLCCRSKALGHPAAEPGWKLAALIIISNMKWTYLSSMETALEFHLRNPGIGSPGIHLIGRVEGMELMIWWAARATGN